jgi:hypothetical protein
MTAALAQARPLPQPESGEWFQDKRPGQRIVPLLVGSRLRVTGFEMRAPTP